MITFSVHEVSTESPRRTHPTWQQRTKFVPAIGHERTFGGICNTIERPAQPWVLLKLARIIANIDIRITTAGFVGVGLRRAIAIPVADEIPRSHASAGEDKEGEE